MLDGWRSHQNIGDGYRGDGHHANGRGSARYQERAVLKWHRGFCVFAGGPLEGPGNKGGKRPPRGLEVSAGLQ